MPDEIAAVQVPNLGTDDMPIDLPCVVKDCDRSITVWLSQYLAVVETLTRPDLSSISAFGWRWVRDKILKLPFLVEGKEMFAGIGFCPDHAKFSANAKKMNKEISLMMDPKRTT